MADGIIQPQRREAYFASPLAIPTIPHDPYDPLDPTLLVLRDHHSVAVRVVDGKFSHWQVKRIPTQPTPPALLRDPIKVFSKIR